MQSPGADLDVFIFFKRIHVFFFVRTFYKSHAFFKLNVFYEMHACCIPISVACFIKMCALFLKRTLF